MASTAELLVSIRADASQATSAMTSFGDALKGIGASAASMATGMLAANLAMGLEERFADAAEQIDKYGKAVLQVQRISGESAESSSLLVAIFERYAPSVDEATTRLARFEKVLAGQEDTTVSAASSGKRASEYLAEFGVQATTAEGRLKPTTEILLELADGFKGSGDAAQKNAALTALFGRGSQDMLKMLNQGRDGLQAFMVDAQKYGLVLSQENVQDVAAFVAAHKTMDLALQGVSIQLGAAFMPSITAAAQVTSSFAQTIATTVVPVIKSFGDLHIEWLVPATAGALVLGSALQFVGFATAPLTGIVTTTVAAITGQGVASAAAAVENTALAGSEVAVGVAAAGAAPEVAALGTAAKLAAVGGLATAAATVATFGAAIYAFSQPLRDSLDTLHQLKVAAANIPDSAMNPIQRKTKDLLDALPDIGVPSPASAVTEAPEAPEQATALPGVKAATAAHDAATAHLKDLQNDAANRQATFDMAHVGAQTDLLNLKMQQSAADAATLAYKRQIEDIDRNAVNFAQQRVQLEEQADVLRAQMAESPLKNQSDDNKYQEALIKAQLAAARHGGPSVDTAAAHRQLRDLNTQDIQNEPGLLQAEHNVALANRAKTTTDQQVGLDQNAVNQQKLDVNQALAPATQAAVLATRAIQDAQALLDLDKSRFDLSAKTYETAKLLAEATERTTTRTLFMLQHPDAVSPAPTTAKAAPYDASRAWDVSPSGVPSANQPAATATSGGVHIDLSGMVMNGVQDAEDIAKLVRDQLVAAWNAASSNMPVSGAMAGNNVSLSPAR